jgi:hypothetical protein
MPNKRSRTLRTSKRVKHGPKSHKGTKKHSKPYDDRKVPRLVEGQERRAHEEIIEGRITGGADVTRLVEGQERRAHEEIIEGRIVGGAEATPELYRHALEQWQEIPGSVMRPPTDVTLPSPKRPKSQEGQQPSEQADNDKNKEAESG